MRLQLNELGVVVKVFEDGIYSVKIIFDGFTLVRHRDFLDLNLSESFFSVVDLGKKNAE
jgi:hypothetical protein